MRKKYLIVAFTFLLFFVIQNSFGQIIAGDYGDGPYLNPCDHQSDNYDPYDPTCETNNDVCDPMSTAYNAELCTGGSEGSSGSGGSGGGGSSSGGTNPSAKPLTKQEFDKLIADNKAKYHVESKSNTVIKTDDGLTHTGTLTKFQTKVDNKTYIFYYFTPNATDNRFQTGSYYRFPDSQGMTAAFGKNGSVGNTGSNAVSPTYYTYDLNNFPIGQGYYYTSQNGGEVGIMILSNNTPVTNVNICTSCTQIDPDPDPGSTGGTGTGGTGTNTGGGPNLIVAIPKTQQQFDAYMESTKPFDNIVSKPGQIFTTSDGVQHEGTLIKLENGLMEYWFTPTIPDARFKTGYYYRIPDPKQFTSPSSALDYTTRAYYIYDFNVFPIGGNGYIIQDNGLPTNITILPNNEAVEYIYTASGVVSPSLTPLIGSEFANSFAIPPLGLTVKYKTESSNEVVASIAKHIMDMSAQDLTRLVYYYNATVNADPTRLAVPSDFLSTISSFYSGNYQLNEKTQKFIDWLARVAAIQMSANSENYEIEGSESYDSSFEEDDDFAEAAQTDPFFANNPDDPWRLKQYLSPDDTYLLGIAAGLGDGFIETADLAYTLTKYGIKNSGPVLLFNLITDTKNTVQQQIDKIQVVKGLVSLIYDKTKQEQIFNAIQSFVGNWFDEITFQKTNVQAGYQHGKILFEVLGALVGVEELKLLLKTGEFSTNALRIVNKLDNAFTSGRKFRNIDGVPHLLDEIGNPISHGDDIARVTENLADPVNDVQRTLRDQYESIVDDFEETIGDFSNKIKGNYGEIATDVKLSEKGYIPLHDRIDDINAGGHNGIDGVFEKDGQYFIVESKFSKTTTPSLNPANESTGLHKQMSKNWIERENELGNAIGDIDLAEDIIDSGYTSILATHGPNGSVTYKLVDSAGNIGSTWTP